MPYDPKIHHRRSIRLKEYDYSTPGWYFVTICVAGKEHLLGEVVDGEMRFSEAGQIVRRAWQILPKRFPQIVVDEHVVMPNHFHGIVQIVGAGLAPPSQGDAGAGLAPPNQGDVGAGLAPPNEGDVGAGLAPPSQGAASSAPTAQGAASRAPTLAAVVRAFKSLSGIAVNALLSRQSRQFWQRNYYEHIIRNDRELVMIRDYIRSNPQRWGFDRENHAATEIDLEPWV